MFKQLILLLILFSCSSAEKSRYSSKAISKTFLATYNATWEAVLDEVSKFSLQKADKISGVIITDTISSYIKLNSFDYNNTKIEYYFYINVDSPSKNDLNTTLSVNKFSILSGSKKVIGTDYTDENLILYRVKRNLILKRKKFERAPKYL